MYFNASFQLGVALVSLEQRNPQGLSHTSSRSSSTLVAFCEPLKRSCSGFAVDPRFHQPEKFELSTGEEIVAKEAQTAYQSERLSLRRASWGTLDLCNNIKHDNTQQQLLSVIGKLAGCRWMTLISFRVKCCKGSRVNNYIRGRSLCIFC